jgi:hypothetical protein
MYERGASLNNAPVLDLPPDQAGPGDPAMLSMTTHFSGTFRRRRAWASCSRSLSHLAESTSCQGGSTSPAATTYGCCALQKCSRGRPLRPCATRGALAGVLACSRTRPAGNCSRPVSSMQYQALLTAVSNAVPHPLVLTAGWPWNDIARAMYIVGW